MPDEEECDSGGGESDTDDPNRKPAHSGIPPSPSSSGLDRNQRPAPASCIVPKSSTRLTALLLRDAHDRHANPARMLSPPDFLRNVRPSRVQIVPKRGHRADALIGFLVEDQRVRQKECPLDPRPRCRLRNILGV